MTTLHLELLIAPPMWYAFWGMDIYLPLTAEKKNDNLNYRQMSSLRTTTSFHCSRSVRIMTKLLIERWDRLV